MANFDMPWEQDQQETKVTTIAGGNPTQEEAEAAFDKLFKESQNALDKWFNEVWT